MKMLVLGVLMVPLAAQASGFAGRQRNPIHALPPLTACAQHSPPAHLVGHDEGAANAIEAMGGSHLNCPVSEFVVDQERKVISTPAYMLAQSISEAASGINKMVDRVLELTHEND